MNLSSDVEVVQRDGHISGLRRSAIRTAEATVAALPASFWRALLRRAALAPPILKTPLFESVCRRIMDRAIADRTKLAVTNLGIASKLRCAIPIGKSAYVFGRPQNMVSERATLALTQELSCDCSHFVDAGAHEGLFIFVVNNTAMSNNLQVHWFEPDGDLYRRLARNLTANAMSSQGHMAAVAARRGTIAFHKNLSDDASGSITDGFTGKHDTRLESVDALALGDYLESNDLLNAFLKVDVEGAGYDVWCGMARAVDRIKYLVMEVTAPEAQKGLPAKIITETGLRAYYIRDFTLEESREGNFRYVAPFWNWLFCRLDPVSLATRLAGTKFGVVAQQPS